MTKDVFSTFEFSAAEFPIVAEIAQAHDGSLGTAHAYIDTVAERGAQAIKFQTHFAAAESTLDEPWRVKFSRQDDTRYAYWKRMEFTPEQWAGLAQHAEDRGLTFLSSPFSVEAVELLDRLGVPCWKVASGETANPEILDAMWRTGKPLMVSTGMSDSAEIDKIVQATRSRGNPVLVFQCTTSYPCPPDSWGLTHIAALKQRLQCPIGFSDHSGDIYAGLAAASLGADLLEVHVAFSKDMFGPDTAASVTLDDLSRLVQGTRAIRTSLSTDYSKNALSEGNQHLKVTFGRSWALRTDLQAGHVLRREDLALKKPGGGLAPDDLGRVLGRTLKHYTAANRLLRTEDLQ